MITLSPSLKKVSNLRLKQIGKLTSYYPTQNDSFLKYNGPTYTQLIELDSARRNEPYISNGVQKVVYAICKTIGNYTHPDEEIQEFIRMNLSKRHDWLPSLIDNAVSFGNGVGEKVYSRGVDPYGRNRIFLDRIPVYHPLDVDIIVDDTGYLSDGKKCLNGNYSGIWVPAQEKKLKNPPKISSSFSGNKVRLKEDDRVNLILEPLSGSGYGRSMIESIIKFHIYKEVYLEMQSTALDRYGTPLIIVKVPHIVQSEEPSAVEGQDFLGIPELENSQRNVSYADVVKEKFMESEGQSIIVLSEFQDRPVDVKVLTTGNNFSSSFIQAIEACNNEMLIGIGIPNLIIKDNNNGLGTGGAAERQIEAFQAFISHLTDITITMLREQVIKPLIKLNFNPYEKPASQYLGDFTKNPFRNADLDTMTKMVKELTTLGYINPNAKEDSDWVRSLFNINISK